ncbi:MAG: hypothetical protein Q9204_004845, partial [Flavoplaca sp. TL-2023a]
MHLNRSQPALQDRAERFRPGGCENERSIKDARFNAKDLARFGKDRGNAALWDLYFRSIDQQATVSNAYQGVIDYDPSSNNHGVTEQCAPQHTDENCILRPRAAAYAA